VLTISPFYNYAEKILILSYTNTSTNTSLSEKALGLELGEGEIKRDLLFDFLFRIISQNSVCR
jgi:hypothetical protein